MPDNSVQSATIEIRVRDVLIAGLGDSIAAGEGNPDRPVALGDGGFCFRRFLGTIRGEYFRPVRAGYNGDRACDLVSGADSGSPGRAAGNAVEWARHGARWMSAACHRSLYGYQIRTALALAIENPRLAVTFLPLACSGATITDGLLGGQRARECLPGASCAGSVPGQIGQLQQAMAAARRQRADRKLDLVLLTIGANDINFSGLVADIIIDAVTERTLFGRGGLISTAPDADRILDNQLPARFERLRTALKPLTGGSLSRVVYVSYGHPALQRAQACPGGRDGLDVHPSFGANPERLRRVVDFVSERFLPRLNGLARCEGGVICRDPDSDRMNFVDGHQAAFADHGFCARSPQDPAFDRECFSQKGDSFNSNPVTAATEPMTCGVPASEFRPYAPRARWIRTANDSYFTAMTYPDGVPAVMQPSDIHDATWGALSAVYGGAIHPTAEGHAAMADAALPAARDVLGLRPPPAFTSAPLPPPR
jgi:lysophospholipase L1-like esterase